jgi:isoleucyl-tRNA synthetase
MKSKKTYFNPVDLKVNFPEEEKRLLDRWYKSGVVRKYLSKNKNSKKRFSFLDGPITANNPMGVHHAWGRTYKDLFQRFKNMQGFRQRFQNGFDAQGLWVEVEVEKQLGFKSKKEIEKYGVDKFVQLCRDRVKKFSEIQTEQSKRLGYFMDWEHSYYTLSDDNNYMIWKFLKICYDNGWLYKGNDSVPWCPRCETAISQHEILTEDYKETTHDSVYLSFPIVGRDGEYLLVWTTTPWTIPANIAIAVDSKIQYAKVKVDGRFYWIAKDAVARVFSGFEYELDRVVPGSKLVGIRYSGAFDNLPRVAEVAVKNSDKFHSVVETDPVIMPISVDEGTGLVHTAVSAGTEDFKLGKKLQLPMIQIISDDATYLSGMGEFSGKNAKENPAIILEYLQRLKNEGKDFYFKIEKYTHRYPACWRCKTELVWKVTDEWYISMDRPVKGSLFQKNNSDTRSLRERMIAVAKRIRWIPDFGLEREIDWLQNMNDWLISKKNRYWGLALPIWECDQCGSFEVIGSKEELKQKAVEGWGDFDGKSPHKPQIDKVKIRCQNCGKTISRIEPVGNPWLDAGIVAYSTISSDNKASNFETTKSKPLYLVDKAEWKKWVPADFITESFPGQFKNWFYSLIAMSTVMEDINPFKNVLGFATLLAEDGRPMHKSWGNMIEFNDGADKIGVDVMRWMYARQNPAENLLFGFRTADEVRRNFHLPLWNIYNFFVTYANIDAWSPTDTSPKIPSISKTSNVLDRWILTRLSSLVGHVTKSLDDYDPRSAAISIEDFVNDLSLWYIRRSRNRVGPAATNQSDKNSFYRTTYFVLVTLSKILAPFIPFMSDLIYTNLTKKISVHLDVWPKLREVSNDKLIEDMKLVRKIVEKGHSIRKDKKIAVKQPLMSVTVSGKFRLDKQLEELIKDELNVKEVKYVAKEGELDVQLDLKITEELIEEMMARELIRKIQAERKRMGLNLSQKVLVYNDWLPKDKKQLQLIMRKAQVVRIDVGEFKVLES